MKITMGLWLDYFINLDKVEMIDEIKHEKVGENMGTGVVPFAIGRQKLFKANKWSTRSINIYQNVKMNTKEYLIVHEN